MKVKAVFLDFGGTLAYGGIDWGDYHMAVRVLLASLGYNLDAASLKKAVGAALLELQRHRSKGLEKTHEEFYRKVLRKVGILADDDTLKMILDTFKNYYVSTFYPCTEEVLKKLSESYRLVLISNTMSNQPREMLEKTGMDNLFELIICSMDLGIRKPNPAIFKYALDKLGVCSSETVHVGDNVEADMEGASNSGITPIWIRTSDQGYWPGQAISNICDLPQFLETIQEA